jgi:uncharacterized membrane protein
MTNPRCPSTEMKQTIGWILILVVACAAGSLLSYRIAYHRGYESGFLSGQVSNIHLHSGVTSLSALSALQELRAGNISSATRSMEGLCFTSAEVFYHVPTNSNGYNVAGVAETLTPLLLKYRAAYRTNSADWDDMERKLVVELEKVK